MGNSPDIYRESHFCINEEKNGTRINADIADKKTDFNLAFGKMILNNFGIISHVYMTLIRFQSIQILSVLFRLIHKIADSYRECSILFYLIDIIFCPLLKSFKSIVVSSL